ncbi:MAG: beta-ketoacyl synthase N-terminal-like domain-containing protein, partial [Verrucomicrobiota bacterium]
MERGECDQAFVAGANLLLASHHYRYFCSIGALSRSGRSHTFDHRADGYIPGESVAAVLLKPLSEAERAGDRIYGIVKGSAVSHGGYTPSITAPSVDGEVKVLLKAWADAGIHPASLGYIEAHGTGTKLGDPVEVSALQKAFRQYEGTVAKHNVRIPIGSAKAHLGHAEGAAGIVGLIKAMLSMNKGLIPAMPRFEALNPYIKLEGGPFYINVEPEEWKVEGDGLRRAGVSSFGFGGAYAHAVLEEYRGAVGIKNEALKMEGPFIVPLSAKNEARLGEVVLNLAKYLDDPLKGEHFNLSDLAYTLQVGREAMECRLALVVHEVEELKVQLASYRKGNRKDFLIGDVKKDQSDFLLEGEAGRSYIETAIKKKESQSLA